jgi:asparagine synthase (glutamine-hydrolysing)
MCGITGYFSSFKNNIETHYIQESLKSMQSRGPDGEGTYFNQGIQLGHKRLSIIDLSSNANQPMKSKCGDYQMVFNGEFLNYREIKKELESQGHSFETSSDTEVLIEMLVHYGIDSLNKVRGFFALALYHITSHKLTLARDYAGIKPLFLYEHNDHLFFSSELKSLCKYPIVKEIIPESIHQFFCLSYIPNNNSIFKNISKIPPGVALEFSTSGKNIINYFKPKFENKNLTYIDYTIKIRENFEAKIHSWLESDVNVGCFLSGGVDSSIVTYLASKIKPNLQTYSIGFTNSSFHDESQYSNLVSKKFKTNHQLIMVGENEISKALHSVLDYTDEPFSDSSAIPTYILCNEVSKRVKVALSGDGADEIWGGYDKYKAELLAQKLSWISPLGRSLTLMTKYLPQSRDSFLKNQIRKTHKLFRSLSLNTSERYNYWCQFTQSDFLTSLYSHEFIQTLANDKITIFDNNFNHHFGDFNDFLFKDFSNVLPNDMLFKVDQMSMANSIEVRPFFLDQDLFELCFSIPSKHKIDLKRNKKILIDSFKDVLPREVYDRPKKGFSLNLNAVLIEYLKTNPLINLFHIFDKLKINNFLNQYLKGQHQEKQSFVWSLIILNNFYSKKL